MRWPVAAAYSYTASAYTRAQYSFVSIAHQVQFSKLSTVHSYSAAATKLSVNTLLSLLLLLLLLDASSASTSTALQLQQRCTQLSIVEPLLQAGRCSYGLVEQHTQESAVRDDCNVRLRPAVQPRKQLMCSLDHSFICLATVSLVCARQRSSNRADAVVSTCYAVSYC
jgi:hypothetical protein